MDKFKNAKSITKTMESKGTDKTQATAGKCDYTKNVNVIPGKTPVAKYTKYEKQAKRPNPAKVGTVSTSIVSHCRTTEPSKAGIVTKKVAKR